MAAMPIAGRGRDLLRRALITLRSQALVLGERVRPRAGRDRHRLRRRSYDRPPQRRDQRSRALLPVLSALGLRISAVLARRLGRGCERQCMALSAHVVYIFAGGVAALLLAGTAPSAGAIQHRSCSVP